MALPLFWTWLPHNWTDIDCSVLFSVVTVHCFIYKIALVTFLWLQYWSDYDLWAQKTCIFCVFSLVKRTKKSWNFPENLVLKFHFLLLGALTKAVKILCFFAKDKLWFSYLLSTLIYFWSIVNRGHGHWIAAIAFQSISSNRNFESFYRISINTVV